MNQTTPPPPSLPRSPPPLRRQTAGLIPMTASPLPPHLLVALDQLERLQTLVCATKELPTHLATEISDRLAEIAKTVRHQ